MNDNILVEIEILKRQVRELQETVHLLVQKRPIDLQTTENDAEDVALVSYSGLYKRSGRDIRWGLQEQRMQQLLSQNVEKMAKVLSAMGNKQRLEILRTVLKEPLTGAELVERLSMGTTGQLYHHLKALLGADLLIQEQGGKYAIPPQRVLPFLLLLAASSELLETSDYLSMTEVRDNPSIYFGEKEGKYDPHLLLWAIIENSILEHKANHCSEVNIFLHEDGSVTVSDNGRGIPTQALPNTNKTVIENTLTDMTRLRKGEDYQAPGAESGISMAVVNALSQSLVVEIRRSGVIYHQSYKDGIPQSALNEVGVTKERGTSITFKPNTDLFEKSFDPEKINTRKLQMESIYPELSIHFHFKNTEG